MATYFVRLGGNDGAAGTSPATAWRTIGKALGATGIASGDTVYLGAGLYREAVTVAMTSATAETFVLGDVDGAQTGDAGEVIWTNYLAGWQDTPSTSDVLALANRDFLTFRNLVLVAGSGGNCVDNAGGGSVNITFEQCVMQSYGSTAVTALGAFATAMNWTIRRCLIVGFFNAAAVAFSLTTGVGADYDANILITDSVIWGTGAQAISITASGTAANKGGGVDVLRCTLIASSNAFATAATNLSVSIPCTVSDCLVLAGNLVAGTAGQMTDLGGNVVNAALTSITAHPTTKTATDDFPAPLVSLAHEWLWGMTPRRFLAPLLPGLARGTISAGTTDGENRSRPEGSGAFIDSGTATGGSTTAITDAAKTWKTNEHIGRLVRTMAGTGAGQVKQIGSNTANALNILRSGPFAPAPASGTTYQIYEGPPAETNTATSGTTTTFVVATAAWSVNKWAGYDLAITAGVNAGTTRSIVSNTATTLTTAAFPSAITATSVGSIVWPGTSLSAPARMPGALELHDTAARETAVTQAGGVGISISGPGSHEFLLPVDAASTSIALQGRYDADHGTTTKPQAILLANGECGVAAQTVSMTGAADAWETLAFAPFTPTAKGVVTVRLLSRSATPYGRAYFDSWVVS